ncbi:hypothetical protein Q4493_06640 [Colwellia sp. 1_MG-2023]|uniref:hypothetical protein n=1 Tax=Colwellia sp. 1_MG-2023 TaxID=3062649 RepID=UPI0026E21D73|nr:hypothetical protein [Colwellia sp. 1_MG-2023]MDO6445454.1 hypothetical protein [Colwellia sp. 1_MG-2023]
MAFAAQLSKKEGNTLEDRVNNFRSVYAAFRDIQTSQSLHQQAKMRDTLGSKEELSEANSIIKHSLELAAKDFSQSELDKAEKLGLISDFEARNIADLSTGKDFKNSPNQQEIQKNKSRIAEARASMNTKNKDMSKDKSRDI